MTTTYATVLDTEGKPVRIGLSPDAGNGYVTVYSVNGGIIGGRELEAFGPGALTPRGRIKRTALARVLTLAD